MKNHLLLLALAVSLGGCSANVESSASDESRISGSCSDIDPARLVGSWDLDPDPGAWRLVNHLGTESTRGRLEVGPDYSATLVTLGADLTHTTFRGTLKPVERDGEDRRGSISYSGFFEEENYVGPNRLAIAIGVTSCDPAAGSVDFVASGDGSSLIGDGTEHDYIGSATDSFRPVRIGVPLKPLR